MFHTLPILKCSLLTVTLLVLGTAGEAARPGDDTKVKTKPASAPVEMDAAVVQKKMLYVLDQVLAGKGPVAVCDGQCEKEEKCQQYLAWAQKHPTAFWAKEIAQRKETLKMASPLIMERFAATESTEKRGLLLDLLCHLPAISSPKSVEKLWKLGAPAFAERHVLALASEKGGPLYEILAKRCAKYDEHPDDAPLGPALWFAVRGDHRGEKTLVRAWKGAAFNDCIARPGLAALGLERLGHEGIQEKTFQRIEDAVAAALDAGRIADGRTMTLQAEYLAMVSKKSAAKPGPLPVAWLEQGMKDHCMERAAELTDATDVFAVIEKISPIM